MTRKRKGFDYYGNLLPTYKEKKEKFPGENTRQNTLWHKDIVRLCKHRWQPVSMAFETEKIGFPDGRLQVRIPDTVNGRCYCVCMKCCSHTYIVTGWVGHYIGSPDLLEEDQRARMKIK